MRTARSLKLKRYLSVPRPAVVAEEVAALGAAVVVHEAELRPLQVRRQPVHAGEPAELSPESWETISVRPAAAPRPRRPLHRR